MLGVGCWTSRERHKYRFPLNSEVEHGKEALKGLVRTFRLVEGFPSPSLCSRCDRVLGCYQTTTLSFVLRWNSCARTMKPVVIPPERKKKKTLN